MCVDGYCATVHELFGLVTVMIVIVFDIFGVREVDCEMYLWSLFFDVNGWASWCVICVVCIS